MSDSAEAEESAPDKAKKGSKIIILALPVALLLGGGAFYGVYSGMVPLPFGGADAGMEAKGDAAAEAEAPLDAVEDAKPGTAFVALEPIVVSLAAGAGAEHLKLTVQLEVDPTRSAEVSDRIPRIADVLNTFLRAVEVADLGRPRSMLRLRAQMLRRVQIVIGPGAVHDLLIQEFVLN